MAFRDRRHAGQELARRLAGLRLHDPLVLALPRGGVPVAYEVAVALGAPLDVFVVRKLGVPGAEELAMGAIAAGGARVLNGEVIDLLDLTQDQIERAVAVEELELRRREHIYRGDRPFPRVIGRTVIIVDDGLATGSTMQVAALALRNLGAERIIVAVPVAPPETVASLREDVDDVVVLRTPDPFFAVGLHYLEFGQTTDDEVRELLGGAAVPAEEHPPA
jgi:putative phosphoribosyl transferase